ncbi:MAG: hypothetical protein ACC654_10240 [Acidimicrobiia bacterium]
MTDPDDLLRDIPEESPPPEIVIAAVRGFRYRAIAIIASIVATMFVAVFLLGRLGPSDVADDAAAAVRGGAEVIPVLVEAEYDGIYVAFSELIVDEDTGYIRFLAWDTKGHAQVNFEVVAIEVAGRRQEVFAAFVSTVFSYRNLDGELREQTSTGDWVWFEDPKGIGPPVVLEIQLVIEPVDVVLYGGVLTGPYPTLRLEWDGSP